MNELLRTLVDTRDRQIQKARVQMGNRIFALEKGLDTDEAGQQRELLQRYFEEFQRIEDNLDQDIAAMIAEEPFYPILVGIKGIGPGLAAKMVAVIDIRRAPHVSSLWRYAGYGVRVAAKEGEEDKADGKVKGEKLCYNQRLRKDCYLVGTSFLKCHSPYSDLYYKYKDFYVANRPDWTKMHLHLAALRRMIKIFLQHMWVTWRAFEGLPVSKPYAHAVLGHTHYYRPEDFGWPTSFPTGGNSGRASQD